MSEVKARFRTWLEVERETNPLWSETWERACTNGFEAVAAERIADRVAVEKMPYEAACQMEAKW